MPNQRLKVLQINNVYGQGSTGKITADLHRYLLEHDVDSLVCYGRDLRHTSEENSRIIRLCTEHQSHVQHLLCNITGLRYGCFRSATRKLIRLIEKEQPDVVHIQCINSYMVNIYELIQWLNTHRVPTVLTLHAEFMYTANCGSAFSCEQWKYGCTGCPDFRKATGAFFMNRTAASWTKMQQSFQGFGDCLRVVSVSPWLKNRALQSPILCNSPHTVIPNGLDTSIFHPYPQNSLKTKHGLEGRTVVFHATPQFTASSDDLKGGRFVLALAERLESYIFIIAGDYDPSIQVPDNVILLGRVRDQQQLAQYYSSADVTVVTSRQETFSMVCAESLCCGTPVVGFRAGGPESISLPEYSAFVEYGNTDALCHAVEKMLTAHISRDMAAAGSQNRYSSDNMCASYLSLYRQLLEKRLL